LGGSVDSAAQRIHLLVNYPGRRAGQCVGHHLSAAQSKAAVSLYVQLFSVPQLRTPPIRLIAGYFAARAGRQCKWANPVGRRLNGNPFAGVINVI